MPRLAGPLVLALAVVSSAAHGGLDGASLSALLRAGGDVRAVTKVGPIPGITATSYAGYFQVDAAANASLFSWYWPALDGNASAPVLVWLQGGPGSSSMFGMTTEIGVRAALERGAPAVVMAVSPQEQSHHH